MPYVSQTRHIDRVRNVIEGRMRSPGADASRLASSYRRSLEQYHLDPGATVGPRILTRARIARCPAARGNRPARVGPMSVAAA